VASTRSRPRGREHARPSAGGPASEHATKIYTVAILGIIVIVAFLALTSTGHVVDAATQHFMLFYAGVLTLISLCASVGLGLVATDRMFLHPGHRVLVQSAHRAASFGAVTFLIIHIVTEILAQRSHVLDAVVPFLSPFRTFYIGLGTIASDLIIMLVITGILRSRFNANGKAWRWRAMHYTSYVAFVFGVWHGLLGGRAGKPYVDWSYGFVVAFVLVGLAVRVLSNSLRPKENLSAPPVDQSASSASAPLRAAAMLAQYGATRGGRNVILGSTTGAQPVLSAPVSATVLTALPAGGGASDQAQPFYEPGYEGPPRYLGAPRSEGTGPIPRTTGSLPRVTGPVPRATGPLPQATGPLPRVMNSGPMPRAGSGPMPRAGTGPRPRPGTGSFPASPARPPSRTGSLPRADSGPMPQYDDGRQAEWETGPRSRPGSGRGRPDQAPRGGTGSMPRAGSGPMAPGTGPRPRPDTGSYPRPGTGSYPRPDTGPYPRPDTGSYPRPDTGPYPRPDTGSYARPDSGPYPRPGSGPYPQQGSGAYPQPGRRDSYDGGQTDPQGWPAVGHDGAWYPDEPRWDEPQWDGGFPGADPNLRYREPGPGMPGYRGSREHRYGGDRY
jgi:DMSO/TMAO reductase YedYZ heme-binding membrane subunit